jgi:hypothetical protein
LISPYLSVVATSRNDDHGGNLLRRMNLFVNAFIRQCRNHQLKAELILVEWNPPPDRPRLLDALHWPKEASPCVVRLIEVPNSIHARFRHSENLPLFQMIAKNVGIRRAESKFVLATNIDILFSDELIGFLKSGLRNWRLYRTDRYDVPLPPEDLPVEDLLQFCEQNVIRIAEKERTRNLLTGEIFFTYSPETWRIKVEEKLQDWRIRPISSFSRLHTNASGDFTLMAKKHWLGLMGYPEWEMFSFHLDSVLCHAAHYTGIRERVLLDPMRIYHIDHAEGSGWTPEGEKKLDERLEKMSIPKMTDGEFLELAIKMRRDRKPIIYNDHAWGLRDQSLPEWRIQS